MCSNYPSLVFIPIGLAIFATAMKFDMSDRNRVTQRTDIAFWLHLLAAPLIVHSIVRPLLTESALSTGCRNGHRLALCGVELCGPGH